MAQVQSKKVQKSAENRAATRKEAASTEWSSGKKGEQASQSQSQGQATARSSGGDDYIVPRGKHPDNAVYVARDRKSGAEVSFDSWGRKLDSLGHVVAGDRQRAGDAEAKLIYRPPQQVDVQREFVSDPNSGARLTSLLSPGTGSRQYRSDWDRSLVPDRSAFSNRGFPNSPAPVLEPGARPVGSGTNTNVLSPKGIDPATGKAYPTASNGMLTGQQAAPQWRSPAQQTQSYVPPAMPQLQLPSLQLPEFQSPSLQLPQFSGWDNSVRMPWESFEGTYESPITREPMAAVSGYGMVPKYQDYSGAEPVGPQNYNRLLGVSDYVPAGKYNPQGKYYEGQYYTEPTTPPQWSGYSGAEPVGPQNFNRLLGVWDYVPAGKYNPEGKYYRP